MKDKELIEGIRLILSVASDSALAAQQSLELEGRPDKEIVLMVAEILTQLSETLVSTIELMELQDAESNAKKKTV